MQNLIKIAVDAMGGDNSPEKIIKGMIHNHHKNKNLFFRIFGSKNKILEILGNKISKDFYEIIHTDEKVESTDSPVRSNTGVINRVPQNKPINRPGSGVSPLCRKITE